MHLPEDWKQLIARFEAMLAVLSVVAYLAWLGITFLQTGYVPDIPPGLTGGVLAAVWIAAIVRVARFGKQAITVESILLVVAYTMMMGTKLLSFDSATAEATKNGGYFLMALAMIYWIFGRRIRKTA